MRRRLIGGVIATLLGAGVSLTSNVAVAATPIAGHIEADATWTEEGSPYVLSGEVIVDPEATLTIEPGTQVVGLDDASLVVEGALHAAGLSDAVISFAASEDQWEGVRFRRVPNSPANESPFSFVSIREARTALMLIGRAPEVTNSTFDANARGVVAVNPPDGTELRGNIFTDNVVAVSGRTRGLLGIYESDFWNNETNLLARPQPAYDCGSDSGSWDVRENDLLRGPVNSDYFSNDVRTPEGSAVSSYSVTVTDNWWGTADPSAIEARMRERIQCCPPPMLKEMTWQPFAGAPNTAWEPDGEVPAPPPEDELHGDPGVVTAIEHPDHGRCYPAGEIRAVRGRASEILLPRSKVDVALVKRRAGGCRWWKPARARFVRGPCDRPQWIERSRSGDDYDYRWKLRLPRALRRGRYEAWSYGAAESQDLGRNRVRFRVVRSSR